MDAFCFFLLFITTCLQLSESSTSDLGSSNIPEQFESKEGVNYSGNCVLPLRPPLDTSVSDVIRFGNTQFSRQEIIKDPEFMFSIMHETLVAMEFKTTGATGVMFYVSAGCERIDYIGLFMREGRLVYVFDCGSGSAVITSNHTYNDGEWHRVVFLRHSQEGRMVIDKEDVRGSSPGYNTRVDQQKSPFYVGGLPEERTWRSRHNLQGVVSSFPGCIRNVEIQRESVTRDTQMVLTDTSSCSDKVEEGAFFSAFGGYLVLHDKYYVGQWSSISMEVKPRHLHGVLMAIHSSKRDFLTLQLIDGRVQFTLNNSTHTSPTHQLLCDGRFHTVRVTNSNSTITVTVDNSESTPTRVEGGRASVDTFDPLYVGGLPSGSARGVETREQFVGCIRNIRIDDQPLSMAEAKVIGHATLNTCPTE